ncbi:hypothetical protein GCK72_011048 [Caenorhabditis remanei]|uniref:DUF281 domain-containing protein n=1 Tax=Caenorhabditis remanei TaxID=31234 RepID=A0A6A5H6R1_CAERE|nr:hypothetical protein GCK72_011048 [Caenorhabditis remanei]KAF1762785.1 hypothetical protein GCK72_011048 [Caenorhabditis remanei]
MILILLLLLFPTVVENCLVVKTVEPPKCECQSLALSISNIESIIGNHEFYKSNISKYSIHAPKISIDDCHTQMYCEGVYSLVVFDDIEKYHVFGAYSTDGLCDPFTQKWLVDDGSATLTTYGKMQGVCVDYTTKAYTCPCRLYSVDTQNAREMISPHEIYQGLLYKYQLIRPTLPDKECPSNFSCPQNMTSVLLVSSYYNLQGTNQFTCGTDEFNTPVWRNDQVSMFISDDRCTVSYGCKRGVALTLTKVRGEILRSDRFDAVCHVDEDEDTNTWTVVQHKSAFGEEQIFENQDLFAYACATTY